MKIRKLRLQNFRGFEDKTFDFSDQFNVLIGDNGTGKTSVLSALATAFSPFIGQFISTSTEIPQDDVRRLRQRSGQTITLEPQYPVVIACEVFFIDKNYKWDLTRHSADSMFEGHITERHNVYMWSQGNPLNLGGDKTFAPLIAYYGTGRLWGTSREEAIEWDKPGSRFEGYEGCLDPAPNATSLLGWLKRQEAIALQDKAASGVFKAVTQAIAQCMEGWGGVFYDFKEDDLIAISVDDSRALPFRMLSDGERNMLAMVADIARRAAILNPHLEERALAETPGIVLIDELDLHLHPRWQRRVVDNLRETFPNLQFIATTHSPFIIQSLRIGELIDLNEGEPADYVDKPIDYVAEFVQGVSGSSPRYEKMMEAAVEYYRVLEQAEGASPEEVERLKRRLDELVAPFSDDVAYHAFLKMEREAAGLNLKKNNT